MSKLFIKQSVINQDQIQKLLDHQGKMIKAGVMKSNTQSGYDPKMRSATIKQIKSKLFPDVNDKIMGLLKQFDPSLNIDDYHVAEYNFLIYNVGDHFKWHRDTIPSKDGKERKYSTTTVLSLSDDLEGGEFGIQSGDGFATTVNLNVGETLLFDSMTRHQVYPVTKGKRIVLVAWIHNK